MAMNATGAPRNVVAPYLEALVHFIAVLPPKEDVIERNATTLQLQSTAYSWRAALSPARVNASLTAQTCEALVRALKLVHTQTPESLPATVRSSPYICAFLALACTVRSFEEAQDLPVAGQPALIHGLQSAQGQQMNGITAVVERFDAASGRFIVRLQPGDEPADWKKVKAENLKPTSARGENGVSALEGVRECGRGCLEAVADIFDELLRGMQDFEEEPDEGLETLMGKFLHSELAVAMWEALVCCSVRRALRGAELLELCGDASLCSHLARDILSAHLSAQLGLMLSTEEQQRRGVDRLRGLQESFARAYCDLFQPAALWGTGCDPGDASIEALQQDLDGHVQRVAASAVHMGVFAALTNAAEFHLAWAAQACGGRQSLPLVLPVLLCRLICAVLASSQGLSEDGFLRRHLQMLVPDLLGVVIAFGELLAARPEAEAASELCVVAHVILDMVISLTTNGLWDMGPETVLSAQGALAILLANGQAAEDPALLARLVLVLLRCPAEPRVVALYQSLGDAQQVHFWRQLSARSRMRGLDAAEAIQCAEEWLGVPPAAPVDPSSPTGERQLAVTEHALEMLIERNLAELPSSLRDIAPPQVNQATSSVAECAMSLQAGEGEPAAPFGQDSGPEGVPAGGAAAGSQDRGEGSLSVLGLPALPGMQGAGAGDAAARRRRGSGLSREAVAGLRHVDPSKAPEALRCAIDGKLLGKPLRSPHGHLFEKTTLQEWLSSCGSVCPITSLPLRLEDCTEDRDVERQVVEWVKAAKAEHRQRVEERRLQRQLRASEGADAAAPWTLQD